MWCFDPHAALGLRKAAESGCIAVASECAGGVRDANLCGTSTRMLRWGSALAAEMG